RPGMTKGGSASTRQATRSEKIEFLLAGLAAEQRVPVRETAESSDDVGVILGVFPVLLAGLREQLHTSFLVGELLRMHERHVEKLPQVVRRSHVDAARDRVL